MDMSIIHIIGIEEGLEYCNISVNFTRCTDPDPDIEKRDSVIVDSHVTTVVVDSISSFYGHDVTVKTIISNCQSECQQNSYLPDMQPTG